MIGFVGLGFTGLPISRNLLKAGPHLVGYDIAWSYDIPAPRLARVGICESPNHLPAGNSCLAKDLPDVQPSAGREIRLPHCSCYQGEEDRVSNRGASR